MSPFWEKFFFVLSFLSQGASYISASAYGIMHRRHHVYTDLPEDPHSPTNDPNILKMMWTTKTNYNDILFERVAISDNERKDLPEWKSFDRIVHTWPLRVIWLLFYIGFWVVFADAWWQWLFLPMTMMIGALQGVAVNYFAHIIGYTNFKMENTSKNLYPFFDFIFWGEAYHNNHHKYAGKPNHAIRWFEYDPMYTAMRVMNKLGIIKLKRITQTA